MSHSFGFKETARGARKGGWSVFHLGKHEVDQCNFSLLERSSHRLTPNLLHLQTPGNQQLMQCVSPCLMVELAVIPKPIILLLIMRINSFMFYKWFFKKIQAVYCNLMDCMLILKACPFPLVTLLGHPLNNNTISVPIQDIMQNCPS